jgi:crotonobetainyl-CoA:carnitine CoA-transferase CaiB-like acyl-CoA transferase
VPGIVPKLSETPGQVRKSGGAVGRDTESVLTELAGLSANDIERLCAQGVIFRAELAPK